MKTKISTIVIALISTIVSGQAQVAPAPVTLITANGTAVPIRSVTVFSTNFDAAMKKALGNLGAEGQLKWGAILDKKIDTTVARDVVTDILDTRLIVWGNAMAMTTDQVAALRMGLRARAQVAATTKQALAELAVGKLSPNIFEGRLYRASQASGGGVLPVDPAPINPAPVGAAPVNPAPVIPVPVDSTSVTPAPVAPATVIPASAQPASAIPAAYVK